MLRFLAFVYDPTDQQQEQAYLRLLDALVTPSRREWQIVCSLPGLVVWSSGSQRLAAPAETAVGHGIIVGRLIAKPNAAFNVGKEGEISGAFAEQIVRSNGSILGEHYWGPYVAIVRDPRSGKRCVIRDPAGTLPCFRIEYFGVQLFFSDIEDIKSGGLWTFRINYEYLRASVQLPRLQKRMTGLDPVEEVLPGECWSDTAGGAERIFIWNPYAFTLPRNLEVGAAAAILRGAVEETVWELVRPYQRIVHNIGGLDSSILYACLATAPSRPEISVLNYTTPSRRGDERIYAREMVSRYGGCLIERFLDHRAIGIDELVDSCSQVSPQATFDCLDKVGNLYELEEVREAEALFYGVGGDDVFLKAGGLLPLLDYVRVNGLGPSFTGMAANAIHETRQSAAHVLMEVARQYIGKGHTPASIYLKMFTPERWPGYNPELLSGPPDYDALHPLLVAPREIPMGKYFQVISTCFCPIEYYDRFFPDSQKERVHVYLAQPIVEACLQIPTWHFALNGVERGLARRAFKDSLPDRVSRRVTKSTPTEVYEAILEREFERIREFLLDGVLVKNQIFCRRALETILSDKWHEIQVAPTALFGFFSWEAWARNWS